VDSVDIEPLCLSLCRGRVCAGDPAGIFGPAQFIPDSFHGKVAQPLWITLARLGKGDDMFGDNYRFGIPSIYRQLFQSSFERIDHDSGVCREIAVAAKVDWHLAPWALPLCSVWIKARNPASVAVERELNEKWNKVRFRHQRALRP
jgi:hypothetical protein